MSITKKVVIQKLDSIEKKLPNGELQKIINNTKEIKEYLQKYKNY
tara:strand:+ start:1244 stop:1378 length:135 start_codon:yes stop_codon:yes gene_type:complete